MSTMVKPHYEGVNGGPSRSPQFVHGQALVRVIRSVWPVCGLLGLAVVPALYHPSLYVQETFLPFSTQPISGLNPFLSLWQGGFLGYDVSANPTVFFPYALALAVLNFLGVPAAYCQPVWGAAMMFLASLGMYMLCREILQVQSAVAGFLAGLSYEYSAYVVNTLANFGEWLDFYALLPYEVLLCLWFVQRPRNRMRNAIVLGLLIGLIPANNLTIWVVNCLAVAAFVIYSIWAGSGPRFGLLRPILVWGLVAALAMSWWLWPQILCYLANTGIFKRFLAAEGPALDNQASSLFHTFRLTTEWDLFSTFNHMSYYKFAPWYLSSTAVTLASFLQAAGAFLVLLSRSVRHFGYFACLAIIAVFMVVGAYPPDQPGVQGNVYLWLYAHLPLFSIFRGGNKFLPLLALVYALGTAATYVLICQSLRGLLHRIYAPISRVTYRISAALLMVIMCCGLLVIGQPLWQGQDYQPARLLGAVPRYWSQVQAYLRQQGGPYNLLALPMQFQPSYTWGTPITDILDDRQSNYFYVSHFNPVSATGLAHPNLDLLSQAVTDLSTQRLSILLRLLGIKYIVNRYDLNPKYFGDIELSPKTIASLLRHTPGVQFDRRFGPVEVYRVQQVYPSITAMASPAISAIGTTTSDLVTMSQRGVAVPSLVLSSNGSQWDHAPVNTNSQRLLNIPASGRYRLVIVNLSESRMSDSLVIDDRPVILPTHVVNRYTWTCTAYLGRGIHHFVVTHAGSLTARSDGTQWALIAQLIEPRQSDIDYIAGLQRWNDSAYLLRVRPSERPLIIALNQRFSPGWQLLPWPARIGDLLRALIKPSIADHWIENGYANAWVARPHQDSYLLVYMPTIAFLAGCIVSLGTASACAVYGLHRFRSGRAPA